MISVIVPVYNVEPYLRQCLDSLVHQTYRDIEIILIDDGSTDGSGSICNEYRKRDERIIVFHTENHGLSAARNFGIDKAHGEWIMFVDSDDWVEPQFCELPVKAALESEADLVVFRMIIICLDGSLQKDDCCLKGIVSAQEAVEFGHSAVWNKLYHRSLFGDIRYPEKRVCEDTAITHRLVYQAKCIYFLDEYLYNYQRRKGSIASKRDWVGYHDLYLAYLQKYDDLRSYGYPEEKLKPKIEAESLRYLMRAEASDDPLYCRAADIVSACVYLSDGLKAHERNALKIWRLNRKLFHMYCRERGWTVEQRT